MLEHIPSIANPIEQGLKPLKRVEPGIAAAPSIANPIEQGLKRDADELLVWLCTSFDS